MVRRKTKLGTITISDDANVWPHEMRSAKTLVRYGYNVEFITESKRQGEKRADCYLNNVLWEMKAPRGATLDVVDRNLRRAAKNSRNVVFDSRRIKNIPDTAIERELIARLKTIAKLDKIILITRHAKIIDIE